YRLAPYAPPAGFWQALAPGRPRPDICPPMAELQTVSIVGDTLEATVSSLGAELVRLNTADGLELLWDGNPAVWAGRSPLLFPIVGGVAGDRITVDGRRYPRARHGFARTAHFELIEAEPARCLWRLRATAETRLRYPFGFQLDIAYAIDGNQLRMSA